MQCQQTIFNGDSALSDAFPLWLQRPEQSPFIRTICNQIQTIIARNICGRFQINIPLVFVLQRGVVNKSIAD